MTQMKVEQYSQSEREKNNCQTTKLLSKNEGKINTFSDKNSRL